jgi:hypothetical protein
MSLEKVTKDHPLRREQKWERFLGEKVEAGFKCQVRILVQNNIEALLRGSFSSVLFRHADMFGNRKEHG